MKKAIDHLNQHLPTDHNKPHITSTDPDWRRENLEEFRAKDKPKQKQNIPSYRSPVTGEIINP